MERITQTQVFLLFGMFQYIDAMGFLLSTLTSEAGYDGWISLCLSTLCGFAVAWIGVALARLRPEQHFVRFGRDIVGAWLHVPLMIVAALFYLQLDAIILRNYQDFVTQTYLPETPGWVIAAMLAACVALIVRSGLEAVFRAASSFFFLGALSTLLLPLLAGGDIIRDMASAFLHVHSLARTGASVVGAAPRFGELAIVVYFFPNIANSEKTVRTLFWASLVGLGMLLITWFMIVMLLGPELTGQLAFPILELVRYPRIGDFIENLDTLLVVLWTVNMFVKLSLLFYIAVCIIAKLLKLNDHRPLTFALAAALVGMSLHIVDSTSEMDRFLERIWPRYAIAIELLPLLYLLVYPLRRHKLKSAPDGSASQPPGPADGATNGGGEPSGV